MDSKITHVPCPLTTLGENTPLISALELFRFAPILRAS